LWYVILGLHLTAMSGMLLATGLQLLLAPHGPLKRLKWLWLPTVGGAAVTGLLLIAFAGTSGHHEDAVKMFVKIVALLVGSGIAAKYHRCERVDTPVWAVPALGTVVTSEAVLSLLWH
jgi:hypothetical protein